MVAVIVLLALAAPWIAPYPYDEFHTKDRLQRPSANYWFGTDEFGRDVLSRVLVGSRISLFMGIGATGMSLILGVPLGLLAGCYSGRIDEIIMRFMDLLMSFPPVILGLLILAVTEPNIVKTAFAVGIVYVPVLVRLTRSVTLELMENEFILAAKARGENSAYILAAEVLPNAWPPIIVEASLRITFAILLAAALSFLGLGAQPPSSDWGLMISEARSYIDIAPWIVLFPGLAMCTTVIAVNLLGDGLREKLDPRMKRK
jgi:peptide/nickel transport system permease protein